MIKINSAVELSRSYLNSLMGKDQITDIRLEEVEIETTESDLNVFVDYWLVTLSYLPNDFDPLESKNEQRIYKTFRLLGENGELQSMKIRELAQV